MIEYALILAAVITAVMIVAKLIGGALKKQGTDAANLIKKEDLTNFKID